MSCTRSNFPTTTTSAYDVTDHSQKTTSKKASFLSCYTSRVVALAFLFYTFPRPFSTNEESLTSILKQAKKLFSFVMISLIAILAYL